MASFKIDKAIISKMLCASLFLNFGACSIIDNLGLEGLSPSRLSTTGIGAATGGALGAGVGLIVGSTTGDAGEGFLIGTGVGAVAGAAVGYELESQGEELAAHKSTISRQEQEIQQQKLELQQLKGGSVDLSSNRVYHSDGTFSIPEQNRSSREIFGNVQAVTETQKFETAAYQPGEVNTPAATIQENDLIASDIRSQLTPDSGITVRTVAPVLPSAKGVQNQVIRTTQTHTVIRQETKPVVNFEKNQRSSNSPVRIAKTYGMDVEKKMTPNLEKETIVKIVNSEEVIVPKSVETVASAPVKQAITFPVKTVSPAKTEVASNTQATSGTCADADGEVSRARNAASDTDKLFYYRRALRLCKSKPEYHVEIGRVYSSIGRREEAEFEFSRALEIDPEYRDAQDELTMLMLNNTY